MTATAETLKQEAHIKISKLLEAQDKGEISFVEMFKEARLIICDLTKNISELEGR